MRVYWDGYLPERRYAIFSSFRGNYAVILVGRGIETAENWQGFVQWLGAVKEPVHRDLKSKGGTQCSSCLK